MRVLVERYAARGRSMLDLSVLHDNAGAIALYQRLGFRPAAPVVVKRKNPINQPLFSPEPAGLADLNPYARIVVDEDVGPGLDRVDPAHRTSSAVVGRSRRCGHGVRSPGKPSVDRQTGESPCAAARVHNVTSASAQ